MIIFSQLTALGRWLLFYPVFWTLLFEFYLALVHVLGFITLFKSKKTRSRITYVKSMPLFIYYLFILPQMNWEHGNVSLLKYIPIENGKFYRFQDIFMY